MVTISPSEMTSAMDTVRKLQKNSGILLVALKKRGPRRQDGVQEYNEPFAALVLWPPPLDAIEALAKALVREANEI